PALGRAGTVVMLASGARLAVTGVGCTAAAEGARRLIASGCGALASWGLAGGLDPSLPAGVVLLPEEIALAERPTLRTASDWMERSARSLGPLRPRVGGKLLTSPRAFGAAAEKARAFRETGALAVDMESYAVAEVAAASGVPFVTMRVIVDTALDGIPPALAGATDAAGRVSVPRVLLEIAARPAGLAALLRLARRYRIAMRSLRAVARTGALTADAA
ncbi:MAG: purine and other phosphorylase-like protein, family 1, partial [Steroidobacteraceae bacterium]